MNVLVLAPHYTTFIKDSVEACSNSLSGVEVLLPHNLFAEITTMLPAKGYLAHVRRFTKERLVNWNDRPRNVDVNLVPVLYFIPDASNKRLGDMLSRKFDEFILKNKIEFDLIHAHFTWPMGYMGATLKQKYGVPLVVTAHGHDIYHMPFRDDDWKDRTKKALDAADRVITVSRNNVDCINRLDVVSNVEVIPNGFRSEQFRPAKVPNGFLLENGVPEGRELVLTVGNLDRSKGHEHLIKAAKKVLEQRQTVHFLIVGGGPLLGRLRKMAKDLGVEDHFTFLGARPHEEIPLWINACHVFVLSSLFEGNPTVMFECLGCGKPFVGTRVGGIPETITSEENGLMCQPGNDQELADCITQALDKAWDEERIAMNAQQYDLRNLAERIVGVYHDVVRI